MDLGINVHSKLKCFIFSLAYLGLTVGTPGQASSQRLVSWGGFAGWLLGFCFVFSESPRFPWFADESAPQLSLSSTMEDVVR